MGAHACGRRARRFRFQAMAGTALAALTAAAPSVRAQAQADASNAAEAGTTLQRVVVTGQAEREESDSYRAKRSRSATGLDLELKDTPQSISVITRTLMDDFRLDNVNAVLATAVGVNVESVETDRAYYTARGFDIVNVQLDGLGLPLNFGIADGDLDTAIYERIDVIRGPAGLLVGTGNPSATLNFVRKRPTGAFEGSVGLTLGSWNDRRIDVDLSVPLNDSGSVRGRVVAAGEEADSYLDRYRKRKTVFYGVVEADLAPQTTLAAGYTLQDNRPRGVLWGALPLAYADGTPTDYDVSASTAAPWSRWYGSTGIGFIELTHEFSGGWSARAEFTHKDLRERSHLLYVFGAPDRATGEGLFAWPSRYDLDNRQELGSVQLSGPFTLGGRKHELVLGARASYSKMVEQSLVGDFDGAPYTAITADDAFAGRFAEPAYTSFYGGSHNHDREYSAYAGARLDLAERWKLIVGANATRLTSDGDSYGASHARQSTRTSPYAGLVWDLSEQVAAYGSYSTIFTPQSELGADLQRLDPATGTNLELGLKSEWLDKRLAATVAVFKSRQNNLASYDHFDEDHGVSIYTGVDTRSQGFELELTGSPLPGWNLSTGYTQLTIEDEAGQATRTFTPRRLVKLATTWQVAAVPGLKLGANASWRSSTSVGAIRQESFALLDLMASYEITKQLKLTLNLNNATDKKYYNSLYWEQAYWAAPRNGSVSLDWSF